MVHYICVPKNDKNQLVLAEGEEERDYNNKEELYDNIICIYHTTAFLVFLSFSFNYCLLAVNTGA
jgi:hypothetical protein